MYRVLLLILLPVLVTSASCPSGTSYNANFNRCYKYVNQNSAFFLAEQDCVSIGGHLASITNGLENALIAETASSVFTSQDYWIGANLLLSSDWSWTDNTPFTYTNWASGQPNSVDQCATVNITTNQWGAVNCGAPRPYVCVVQLPGSPAPPTPCPSAAPGHAYCPDGWTYFTPTDSCYITLLSDSWENAEATCQASGSHLVTIHSAAENTFVADLASTGLTLDWDGMTWIGMHKVNNQWANTDGTPVDFYNWAPGQPDNSKGKENCVQIISDNLKGKDHASYWTGWNDDLCSNSMRALVCKKASLH